MEINSLAIHKKVLKETAAHFDISEEDALFLLKIHGEYIYDKVNEIDVTKDLSDQYTRIVIAHVGVIQVNRVFLILNKLKFGKITLEEYEYCKKWFSTAFNRAKARVENYKKLINLNIN